MSNTLSLSRRSLLAGAATTAVGAGLSVAGSATAAQKRARVPSGARAGQFLTVKVDGGLRINAAGLVPV